MGFLAYYPAIPMTHAVTSLPALPITANDAIRREKVKSVVRVAAGNFLEMYDFMIYGYYAAAIGRAFFPKGSEFASLMLSLGTFGAGFLMRPLGALALGAYLDRHGRRKGLILTLGLMAIGTLSIALAPPRLTRCWSPTGRGDGLHGRNRVWRFDGRDADGDSQSPGERRADRHRDPRARRARRARTRRKNRRREPGRLSLHGFLTRSRGLRRRLGKPSAEATSIRLSRLHR